MPGGCEVIITPSGILDNLVAAQVRCILLMKSNGGQGELASSAIAQGRERPAAELTERKCFLRRPAIRKLPYSHSILTSRTNHRSDRGGADGGWAITKTGGRRRSKAPSRAIQPWARFSCRSAADVTMSDHRCNSELRPSAITCAIPMPARAADGLEIERIPRVFEPMHYP